MRNLITVIEQIIVVAPDLERNFKWLIESTLYTAPEIMYLRWDQAAEILNDKVIGHPQEDEIARIFSGEETT